MSENNTSLNKQQLMFSKRQSSESDADELNRSLPTDLIMNMGMNKEEKNRRDSSVSSADSQTKKPASMNEIQDLYSALHDLVKTNVTTTPVLGRKQYKTSSSSLENSPNAGARFHERTSTVPEKALRKLANSKTSKLSQSSSADKENNREPTTRHKRGLSSGTLEVVNNIMRISPFPNRKFSHDVNSGTAHKEKKSKTTKKNHTTNRHSSSLENNKKWKGSRLFQRFRSKSSPGIASDDEDSSIHNGIDEGISSSDESQDSPPCLNKNRRLSEGDALKIRNKKKANISSNARSINRRSLPNFHDAFKQDDCIGSQIQTSVDDSVVLQLASSDQDLESLESWFEQAAAEVATTKLKTSVELPTYQETKREIEEAPKTSKSAQQRNKKMKNRGPFVKRSSSNITSNKKSDKKSRRNKMSSQSFDGSSLTHAKSAPNLCPSPEEMNNVGANAKSKMSGRLSPFTENDLREGVCTQSNKISLDGNITRLPNVPLFYVPTTEKENGNSLKLLKPEKQNKKLCKGGIFYSEEKTNSKKATVTNNGQNETNNVKKNNNKNKGMNNRTRPKSMFDYLNDDTFIDEKSLWSTNGKKPDNIRNSLHLDTGMQTDDNANFCRTNILNNGHAFSMCDLTRTNNIVQEKSLWERLRKGSSSKKTKAIMA